MGSCRHYSVCGKVDGESAVVILVRKLFNRVNEER